MAKIFCSRCGREIIDDTKSNNKKKRPAGRFKIGVKGVRVLCPRCYSGRKPRN